MALKIIKRISLEFLGEGYKDSYLDFNSIPLKEYGELHARTKEIEKKNDDNASFDFIVDQVTSRFVGGKIKQGEEMVDVTKDNLEDLPGEVILKCLNNLVGDLSPK